MKPAHRSNRLHIAIFGRRNVGKSSLLNALTRQSVSIVSEVAGTTTDPVEKPMELQPIGPCLFIDTAGIDDTGALGELRVEKTRRIFDRADLSVIVAQAGEWTDFEERLLADLQDRGIPVVVVFNKCDLAHADPAKLQELRKKKVQTAATVAPEYVGLLEFRKALIQAVPEEFLQDKSIAGDLVPPGELAVLVVPIDKEAPKGRLILPQVQTIRDLLDNDSYCMVVKERELRDALARLTRPPALVVTDSQAFLKVAADTPADVLMTSFSILFARFKSDLNELVRGAMQIERLGPGDRILIAESCSHHPIADDIGRVKIPRWLRQYTGSELNFDVFPGHDFPDDLGQYRLVIQCGGCTTNRRELLSRLAHCRDAGVAMTNYGLTIAYTLGIFERALRPFPAAMEIYTASTGSSSASGRHRAGADFGP